jgi:dolichol-phosphate mannosyltransferase
LSLLIAIPTYNEAENVGTICQRVLDAVPDCRLLFIDDNSPDGTGDLLEEIAKNDRRVIVCHRESKLGIGSAHQSAIKYAYENKVNILVTMDADFTHSPEHIPELTKLLKFSDVIVASRFIGEGGLEGWSFTRKAMTHLGHLLTRFLLQLPYDASGAFRAYNLTNIPKSIFGLVDSTGYAFFFESLKIIHIKKISISEYPIVLPARTYGHSKMKTRDVVRSLSFMIFLSFKIIVRRKKLKAPRDNG